MNRKFLIIPEFEQLQKSMELAEQFGAGFEYNDFCEPRVYGDEEELQRRCSVYEQLNRDRSEDTLHGVFLDIAVTSQDDTIRQYSQNRVMQSLQIAKRLGVKGVVFHSGLIAELQLPSYLEAWLCEAEKFWRAMAEQYPGINIYLENTFERTPAMLLRLAEKMEDVSNFKLCLDYGHACLTSLAPEHWAEQMERHIGHIHLNDNDGKVDLHLVPGEGNIDFALCKNVLERFAPNVSILLELKGIDRQKKALEYMHKL